MPNSINYQKLANVIRILTIDAIDNAKSGHPGMPLGMADISSVLWLKFLSYNPCNPKWINRDRFIISNGHGSMLLYALLHLTGYNLTINDIKSFRQLHSKTPGHPEYGHTDGVETTTGPLGQGLANAVGMALAEKLLAYEFNQKDYQIINHYTYVFVGDGCLMEGISHEVCSLAGTLQLNKLIVIYDANHISIDGNINNWYTENVKARFEAYNWYVIDNIDGHDINAINHAFSCAKEQSQINSKPILIIFKTIIGYGSPNKANTEGIHGSPVGNLENNLIRKQLNWQHGAFIIPDDIYHEFNQQQRGQELESSWQDLFNQYQIHNPELAKELIRRINHQAITNWQQIIQDGINGIKYDAASIATRKSSQLAINYYAQYLPEILGGSADLTHSNLTKWNNAKQLSINNNFIGNYISYGVREFGMVAISNGVYLYGGFRTFVGTFLMFSEYAKNAMRMASLMQIAPIFIYTHDSIGLGEDGPTHQPIEQLNSLRLTPNMNVWRPCDTVETYVALGHALTMRHTPSAIVLSRQDVMQISRTDDMVSDINKGAYILLQQHNDDNNHNIEILIIATGSEMSLALDVYNILLKDYHYSIQLVSMPSTSVFDLQTNEYKNSIIPKQIPYKIVIEAGSTALWHKYIGNDGLIIGIDSFGESANINDLLQHFGFTTEQIISKILLFIMNK